MNWNGGELLLRCLAALASQTVTPRRILVFDNASTDGSMEMARSRFPGVEFIPSAENLGFARANNQCVRQCEDCEWVFMLNPDAFPAADCLEKLQVQANATPDIDCFAPLIVQARDPDRVDSAGDRYSLSGIATHRLHDCPVTAATDPLDVFAPSGAAAMYRRSAFLGCGGFDESYFAYYEDVDLGFRLQLSGHRTRYAPAARVEHVGAGTTGGIANRHSTFHGQRNFIATYLKNMPLPLFWLGLPLHLLAIIRGIARGIVYGQGMLALNATLAACKSLPGYLVARRDIQARRTVSIATLRHIMGA